jgi:hypothetical protein
MRHGGTLLYTAALCAYLLLTMVPGVDLRPQENNLLCSVLGADNQRK